jgi:hypothetical protein
VWQALHDMPVCRAKLGTARASRITNDVNSPASNSTSRNCRIGIDLIFSSSFIMQAGCGVMQKKLRK